MRATRLVLVLAFVTLFLACKRKEASAAVVARFDAFSSLFESAEPRVSEAPVPERFEAPLPSTAGELEHPERFAPRSALTAALDAGDANVRERVLIALRKAASAGTLSQKLSDFYVQEVLGYTPTPTSCDWTASTATGKEPEAVRALFWKALTRCDDPKLAAVFERPEAPDSAVVEWYFERPQGSGPLAWSPRLEKAAHARAANATSDFELRQIGYALAATTPAKAVEAVKTIQKELSEPRAKGLVALGLSSLDDPTAVELVGEACALPEIERDAVCFIEKPLVDEERANGSESPEQLERCAKGHRHSWKRLDCLTALVGIDRARAVKIAKLLDATLAHNGDQARLRLAARALVLFPEAGALEARLKQLGAIAANDQPRPDSQAPAAIGADELLERYGRVDAFDVETGTFPNEHDKLLRQLALLARDALAGTVFEEVPPASANGEGEYLLRAYFGGKRYEVSARNLGDWYDVRAVLGLLNSLLATRGSDLRFVTLPTGDQTARVLAAPAAALETLTSQGLLQVERPEAGMEDGKAFERQMMEQLRTEGARRSE